MNCQNTFIGVWILPNGNIIYTDNDLSHYKALTSCGCIHNIRKIAKKIQWTKYELDNFLNSDEVYIAFKLGYIRITKFKTQIGIQAYNSNIVKKNIQYLVNAIKNIGILNMNQQFNIIVEEVSKPFEYNWEQFNSFEELIKNYEY